MTRSRIVVRGATTAITRRTNFGKAFLAPWHDLVQQCWLYTLADAQRVHGFALHHTVLVVNHHHTSITPSDEDQGEILRRVHHDMSSAINALLARERYDAPRNLFDGREPHCMRLLDAAAQASHLTYEYLNTVAAGLVARPEDMPGTTLEWGHWKGDGIVVRRPDVYFGPERPEELVLELSPPPLLMQAFDADLEALVHHMRRLSEDANQALKAARKRAPLGAQKLRRMHPWMEPKTLAEPGGRMVPTFKIGARGFAGRMLACDVANEATAFQAEHRHARLERLAGRDALFPHGTYAMRVFHNVQVADPLPDAILAQPGPLLSEVVEELREQRGLEQSGALEPDARARLLEEVRAAWDDEAAEVLEVDGLDFDHDAPVRVRAKTETDAEGVGARREAPTDPRPEPRVRHRFERDRDDPRPHPRRLITQRDRRRGRPRKPQGADPPV